VTKNPPESSSLPAAGSLPTGPGIFGSFWCSAGWFLLAGILVRVLALNQPLVDAHMFRQSQTAIITKGISEAPGWPLGAIVTWRGDLPAYLIQEFPLYNYLIVPVHKLIGHLDPAGKIVSVILWVLGYLVLQRIWGRCLNGRQTFWANFLFVFAPLSVFFGQAFMPEMLVQLLAFSFVLALIRFQEKPAAGRFAAAAAVGLLAMLVKTPEILHLYVILAIMVFRSEGFRALRKPAYWIAMILSVAAIKAWGHLMDANNVHYFPKWAATNYVIEFVGRPWTHVNPVGYLRILMYNTVLVLTPVGLIFLAAGAWRLARTRPWGFPAWWVGSVLFFFLFWSGPVARSQSYYNLPALGPSALLFGLGVDWAMDRFRFVPVRWATAMVMLAMIPFLAGGTLYLFRSDNVVLESSKWIRQHTQPEDLILLKANHREDAIYYDAVTSFPYYAERRFWIYSSRFAPEEMQRALATSKYALVTLPPERTSTIDAWRRRIKREPLMPENVDSVLEQGGFRAIHTNEHFMVYARATGGGKN